MLDSVILGRLVKKGFWLRTKLEQRLEGSEEASHAVSKKGCSIFVNKVIEIG
jgi:hypothetical protein